VSAGAPASVLEEVGALAAALAVVGAFVLPGRRLRALALVVVLTLAPVLLLAELWGAPPVRMFRNAPLLAAGAGVVGFALLGAVAALFVRRPGALGVAAVLALPFRVPIAAGGDSANLLVPLYLVVGAGALAFLWTALRNRDRKAEEDPPPNRLELALLAALVLYAAQAAYSTNFTQALENLVFFYLPFALLLRLLGALEWTPRLLRTCLGVLLTLALVFVAIGFVEFATGTLLLNPKVIAANQFDSFFRVNSLFFDPNIYGRFLVLVMLCVTAVLVWAPARRTVLLAAGALAVLWSGLLLTFSQSSLTALLVGLGVLAALRWGARPVLAAAAAALVLGVAALALGSGLLRLDLGSQRSVDKATSGRLDLVLGGLRLWAENPVVGHGSGSFSERYRAREATSAQTAVAASHTIPITVAAEQGVLGLAVYLVVLATAAGLLARGLGALRGRAPPGPELVARAALAACFAGLIVHTLLYAAFLEDPISWTLLGVAVGLRRRGAISPDRAAPGTAPRAAGPVASGSVASTAARTRTGSSTP
jgi:O-antigen ligase